MWYARVCVEVCGCLRVCLLDEFSEYLLETRVNISADFNMYPIQIFLICAVASFCITIFLMYALKKSCLPKVERKIVFEW